MQFRASRAKNISLLLTLIGAFAYCLPMRKPYLKNSASYISLAIVKNYISTPNKNRLLSASEVYASNLILEPRINASKVISFLAQLTSRKKSYYCEGAHLS